MKKEHPEVENIKNICDINSDAKNAHPVCDKLKNKRESKSIKKRK